MDVVPRGTVAHVALQIDSRTVKSLREQRKEEESMGGWDGRPMKSDAHTSWGPLVVPSDGPEAALLMMLARHTDGAVAVAPASCRP